MKKKVNLISKNLNKLQKFKDYKFHNLHISKFDNNTYLVYACEYFINLNKKELIELIKS
jgi:hypothetical protein